MGALVASTKGANAAVVNALTTAVAANLNNAVVLSTIVSLAQAVLGDQAQALFASNAANSLSAPLIPINPNLVTNPSPQQLGSPH